MKYPELFKPFKINQLEIKNRICMAPMDTKRDAANNTLSDDTIAYYAERAKGGAGMIVTGAFAVNNGIERGMAVNETLSGTKGIENRIRKLVAECHKYGAKLFLQVGFNFGRAGFPPSVLRLVAPSKQPGLWMPEVMCHELTTHEVKKLIRSTAEDIKKYAYDCGCDGVSIVGPYGGYLADQFGNAAFNHRTDEYGGSVEKRSRFTAETIERVRELCGPDFPILVRMSTRNHIEGVHKGQIPGEPYKEFGRDIDESIELAHYYEKAGADAFLPANGCYDALYWQYSPMYLPEGLWLDDFAPFTKAVSVPVIGPGRILTPDMAEEAIEDGKVTAVAMGRALLADPEWANKAEAGEAEEIRPCIGCNNGCIGRVMNAECIMCAVNADIYNERHQEIAKTASPKKIAIIGAGVGGMEAARRLKLAGHDVTIYEKSGELGGIFNVAAAPDFKHGDERLLDWYALQMKELDIPVKLNTEMTADEIVALGADEVIVATGSNPATPPVAGLMDAKPVYASDVLTGKAKVGKKAVVLGAGLIGCETAIALSNDKSRDVTMVEMSRWIMLGGGAPVPTANVEYMERILGARDNVHILTRTMAKSCADGVLTAETKRKGTSEIPFDTIVIATGLRPNQSLYEELTGKMDAAHVYNIGDSKKVGTVMTAVQMAKQAADAIG